MQLAQLNIAKPKAPLDSPLLQEFMQGLGPVNEIAEASPGFIWRLQDESGDATSIIMFDDPELIINMSVWESVETLKNFMFKTHHLSFLKRKTEWFEKLTEAHYVLWRIEAGHIPTISEAEERLQHLRIHSESKFAFTFRKIF